MERNAVQLTAKYERCLLRFQLCAPVYAVLGGIRGTVVARWTAGQLVERSILHQGHDS